MATNTDTVSISIGYSLWRLGLEPETPICLNCRHFHQHYNKVGRVMLALECGHCSFPRLKYRKVTDTCEHFLGKDAHGVEDR